MSFPWKRESRTYEKKTWIPAFAGMRSLSGSLFGIVFKELN
jgi:hypothetical protein